MVVTIVENTRKQPSVIILVAMPDDAVANALSHEVVPQPGGRMPVPTVLTYGLILWRKRDYRA